MKEQIENSTRPTGKTEFKSGSVAAEYLGTEPAMECPIIEPSPKYSAPPLNLLPSVLREYVRAIANSLNVEVAFVFLPLLSALAAAIGNSRNIRLKKGFVQPAILWTAIVARSGSRKSPALSAAMNFLTPTSANLLGSTPPPGRSSRSNTGNGMRRARRIAVMNPSRRRA